jgi:hypothetical protein
MNIRTIVGTGCVLLALAAALDAGAPEQTAATGGWRAMEGTWSAAGRRQTLPTEGSATAAIVHLSGAVVLTVGDGLSRGFRGEFIGFHDGHRVSVGRWVWTDERGDQIFGHVKGEPLQTGRRFVGTITGGKGRYAGITGEYAFTWQYVVEADGTIQGRTSGLTGRYQPGGRQP